MDPKRGETPPRVEKKAKEEAMETIAAMARPSHIASDAKPRQQERLGDR